MQTAWGIGIWLALMCTSIAQQVDERLIDLREFWTQTPRELPKKLKAHFWEPPPATNAPPNIEELIAGLGADSFRDRAVASRALEKLGAKARVQLEQAAQVDDPEISARARDLLANLREIPPDLKPLFEELRAEMQSDTRMVLHTLKRALLKQTEEAVAPIFQYRTRLKRSELYEILNQLGLEGRAAARWLAVIPEPLREAKSAYFVAPYNLTKLVIDDHAAVHVSMLESLEYTSGALRFAEAPVERKAYREAVADFEDTWDKQRNIERKRLAPQIAYLERISKSSYGPYQRHGRIMLYLIGARDVDYLWELFESPEPILCHFAATELMRIRPDELLEACTQLLMLPAETSSDEIDHAARLRAAMALTTITQAHDDLLDESKGLLTDQQTPHHPLLKRLLKDPDPILRSLAIRGLIPYKARKVEQRTNGPSRSTSAMHLFTPRVVSYNKTMLNMLEDPDWVFKPRTSPTVHLARDLRKRNQDLFVEVYQALTALTDRPRDVFDAWRLELAKLGAVPPSFTALSPADRNDLLTTAISWSREEAFFDRIPLDMEMSDELTELFCLQLQYGLPIPDRFGRLGRDRMARMVGEAARSRPILQKRLKTMVADTSAYNRIHVNIALAFSGDPAARVSMRKLLVDPDRLLSDRAKTAMWLGIMQDEASRDAIHALLEEEGLNETRDRARVVYGRGQFRDPKSEALIHACLESLACERCKGSQYCTYCLGTQEVAFFFTHRWGLKLDPTDYTDERLQKRIRLMQFIDGDDHLMVKAFGVKNYSYIALPDGQDLDRYPELIRRLNEVNGTDFPAVPYERRHEVQARINAWWEARRK